MPTLLIHARRGLFQLTKCQNCGHTFECKNCTAKLTTYRTNFNKLELVCHQCQTYYQYPSKCPECGSNKVGSRYSGIDNLAEILEEKLEQKVVRLDKIKDYTKLNQAVESELPTRSIERSLPPAFGLPFVHLRRLDQVQSATVTLDRGENSKFEKEKDHSDNTLFLTTRIYDPGIPYDFFDKIIFIQAENLLASPDYLVQEEVIKSLGEVFLQVRENTRIIFDTNTPELSFFKDLEELSLGQQNMESVQAWVLKHLQKEKENRQKYDFPPFKNLLLLTTQEKDLSISLKKLELVYDYLYKSEADFPEITFSSPYVAKFLKRKNLFSHHLLLKFPRNYEKYNQLQKTIRSIAELYKLQIRLNPKHLF